MGGLSFLRYSVETVVRNRRRSLFAVIGIALAMSLVAGSLIAVDSSAYGLLRSAVDTVQVDFIGQGQYSDAALVDRGTLNSTSRNLEAVENVEDVTAALRISDYWVITNSLELYPGGINYGLNVYFLPEDSSRLLETSHIKGAMPSDGTAAIPKMIAEAYGIERGQEIHLQLNKTQSYYNYTNSSNPVLEFTYRYLNLSFIVSQIWTQDLVQNQIQPYYLPGFSPDDNRTVHFGDDYSLPIVLPMSSWGPVIESAGNFTKEYSFIASSFYFIWIDRGAVIDLANLGRTIERLQFIQHRLLIAGSGSVTINDSELVHQLQTITPSLEGQKVLFLALSLPVIALGTYLSIVGIDLGLSSRRREVGMLKSRGASNRQVLGAMILESVLLGAFAAIIGLVLGVITSRFLLETALSFVRGESGSTSLTDLNISAGTVELALIFGIGLMVLGAYRPFKRVSKTDVAEALHYFSSTTTQVEYRPRLDIVLLALSVISVASVLMGTNWINDSGWSWITRAVLSILMLFGLVIFPIMPFILSLAVVRLLTRGSRRIYSKLTILVKPWTKELHYLVDKNIVRNPRRASNLGVIIALAVAFGLFISITMESAIAGQLAEVKQELGTDVKVTGYPNMPTRNMSIEVLDQISQLDGVERSAIFMRIYAVSSSTVYGIGADVLLVDASDYRAAVSPSDSYFIHDHSSILDDLRGQMCLVEKDYADELSILVGDRLVVTAETYTNVTNMGYETLRWSYSMSVIGIVKTLPGLSSQIIADRTSVDWIPAQYLPEVVQSVGALIKVKSGANSSVVADAAAEVFQKARLSAYPQVLKEEVDALKHDPAYGSLADFLYMEYGMSIAIMSVGVGLIIFVSVSDREHELACIMARGSSGSQMRKILVGESFSLMILGVVVGASVGIITAYLFNTLTQSGFGSGAPQTMVFTYVSLALLAVSILSLVAASFVATARAGKMKLAEVLRIRGG